MKISAVMTLSHYLTCNAILTDMQTTHAPRSNDTCSSESQFSCGGGKCIPKQRMCDGINDCSNGEVKRPPFL